MRARSLMAEREHFIQFYPTIVPVERKTKKNFSRTRSVRHLRNLRNLRICASQIKQIEQMIYHTEYTEYTEYYFFNLCKSVCKIQPGSYICRP